MPRKSRTKSTDPKPRTAYPDRAGRFEIRTPSPDFHGVRHGIQFDRGTGHTDDATRAAACRELGYTVTDHSAETAANEKGKG
jgi:hypothetical protein